MARAFEEQVRLGQFPIEEAQVQGLFGAGGHPRIVSHAAFQREYRPRGRFFGQKEAQVLDGEGFQQALAHRRQHGVQIHLGTQLAGELRQGAAVVVTVAIEILVEPLLNPGADGLEEEGCGQHDDQRRHVAGRGEFLGDQCAQRENNSVEAGQDAQGGQRVGIPPAEEDVDVHQPVAHDGIGQSERNQHHRQHRQRLIIAGNCPKCVRQRVEHGERRYPADGAVAQPFELLPHDGIFGFAVFDVQSVGAQQVQDCREHGPGPVQQPAQVDIRDSGLQRSGGNPQVERGQQQRGQVQQHYPDRFPEPLAPFGKRQAEMQENSGREQAGGYIAEIDQGVERVQVPGIVEAESHKGDQTQHVEVLRFLGTTSSEIHKKSDQEVGAAQRVLIENCWVPGRFTHDDRRLDRHTGVVHRVCSLTPRTDSH